jgi:hypothetical protein
MSDLRTAVQTTPAGRGLPALDAGRLVPDA